MVCCVLFKSPQCFFSVFFCFLFFFFVLHGFIPELVKMYNSGNSAIDSRIVYLGWFL